MPRTVRLLESYEDGLALIRPNEGTERWYCDASITLEELAAVGRYRRCKTCAPDTPDSPPKAQACLKKAATLTPSGLGRVTPTARSCASSTRPRGRGDPGLRCGDLARRGRDRRVPEDRRGGVERPTMRSTTFKNTSRRSCAHSTRQCVTTCSRAAPPRNRSRRANQRVPRCSRTAVSAGAALSGRRRSPQR